MRFQFFCMKCMRPNFFFLLLVCFCHLAPIYPSLLSKRDYCFNINTEAQRIFSTHQARRQTDQFQTSTIVMYWWQAWIHQIMPTAITKNLRFLTQDILVQRNNRNKCTFKTVLLFFLQYWDCIGQAYKVGMSWNLHILISVWYITLCYVHQCVQIDKFISIPKSKTGVFIKD